MRIQPVSLTLLLFLMIGLSLRVCASPKAEPTNLTPVESVDLQRYIGTWHEIAAIPMFFQRKCARETRAEYARIVDSDSAETRIRVLNSCQTAEGKKITAEGQAKVLDPKSNSKLKVTFVKFLGRWWYWMGGDYWILELADDYSHVIVGHPTRKYGWILARETFLPQETLQRLTQRLIELGYDPCDFILTPQPDGARQKMPLCDFAKS